MGWTSGRRRHVSYASLIGLTLAGSKRYKGDEQLPRNRPCCLCENLFFYHVWVLYGVVTIFRIPWRTWPINSICFSWVKSSAEQTYRERAHNDYVFVLWIVSWFCHCTLSSVLPMNKRIIWVDTGERTADVVKLNNTQSGSQWAQNLHSYHAHCRQTNLLTEWLTATMTFMTHQYMTWLINTMTWVISTWRWLTEGSSFSCQGTTLGRRRCCCSW